MPLARILVVFFSIFLAAAAQAVPHFYLVTLTDPQTEGNLIDFQDNPFGKLSNAQQIWTLDFDERQIVRANIQFYLSENTASPVVILLRQSSQSFQSADNQPFGDVQAEVSGFLQDGGVFSMPVTLSIQRDAQQKINGSIRFHPMSGTAGTLQEFALTFSGTLTDDGAGACNPAFAASTENISTGLLLPDGSGDETAVQVCGKPEPAQNPEISLTDTRALISALTSGAEITSTQILTALCTALQQNARLEVMEKRVERLQQRVGIDEEEAEAGAAAKNRTVLSIQQQVKEQQLRLERLDLHLQCVATARHDGVLLWKIGGFAQKRTGAEQDQVHSYYSQPAYTSHSGYKFCARLYPNGDGEGKGTHLSLFFVVMQGEYDNILPWPLKGRITLMLLDQGTCGKYCANTFKTNLASASFQKPTTMMNIASGCPQFIAYEELTANGCLYLKEDTLYIKVICEVCTDQHQRKNAKSGFFAGVLGQ